MKSMVKSVLIGFIRFLYQTRFDVQTIGLELKEMDRWGVQSLFTQSLIFTPSLKVPVHSLSKVPSSL
jgi:hypothetical protein